MSRTPSKLSGPKLLILPGHPHLKVAYSGSVTDARSHLVGFSFGDTGYATVRPERYDRFKGAPQAAGVVLLAALGLESQQFEAFNGMKTTTIKTHLARSRDSYDRLSMDVLAKHFFDTEVFERDEVGQPIDVKAPKRFILGEVMLGRTDQEIADTLSLSIHTVKGHVRGMGALPSALDSGRLALGLQARMSGEFDHLLTASSTGISGEVTADFTVLPDADATY